jgi:hypothetical protein
VTDLFLQDDVTLYRPLMISLGFDPDNTTTDTTAPAGVGNGFTSGMESYGTKSVIALWQQQIRGEAAGLGAVPVADRVVVPDLPKLGTTHRSSAESPAP